MELISTNTVGTAVGSITFSSIPQTYKHLIFMVAAKGTTSSHTLQMTLNGVTTTVYKTTSPYYSGGLVTNSGNLGYFDLMLVGDTATNYGAGTIYIPNYTYPSIGINILGTNTHEGGTGYYGGRMTGTAANATGPVTSATFTKASIDVGTVISLYGVK